MKKAYAYLRISSKSQVRGLGFTRQEQTIQDYAKQHGYVITDIFKDTGISGVKDETGRPAFQDMISKILKNGVRTIIIEGADRLSRSLNVQDQLLAYLSSKTINLISARTCNSLTDDYTSDPMKRAMVQMQGLFAELEKNMLVKKLKDARQRKAQKTGKCEGRKSLKETEQGREIIQVIKKYRRKPRKGKRTTYKEIAERMNLEGLTTVTGKPWTTTQVQNVAYKY